MNIFWQVLLALIAFSALPLIGWGLVLIAMRIFGDKKAAPSVPVLKRIDRNAWIAIGVVSAVVLFGTFAVAIR